MTANQGPAAGSSPRPAWLKWTLIGLAGLVGLGVSGLVAVYIILSGYDYDSLKPRLAEAVRQATGRELTLGGHLRLAVSAAPRLQVEEVALSNPAWCRRPVMFVAKKAVVAVELWPLLRARQLVVKRLQLEGLELNLERDAQGRSNLDLGPPLGPAAPPPAPAAAQAGQEDALGLSFQAVEVNQAVVRWLSRPDADEWDLAVASLQLSQPQAGGALRVAAEGSLQDRPWRVNGALTPAQSGGGQRVELEAGWGDIDLKASGQAADLANLRGVDLQVEAGVARPADLGLGGPPGPWRVQGRVQDRAVGGWRLDPCAIKAGGSAVSGWMEVARGGQRPRFEADLGVDQLDLTTWAPGPAPAGGAKPQPRPAGAEARVFPADPLPLGWLEALDARIALKIGAFKAPGLVWQDVDLALDLADGRLSLAPLGATWSGGRLDLKLGLAPAAKGHAMDLELSLRGSQLGPILREAGVSETLQGEMEAGASLRGQGQSVAAIMAGLNGKSWQVLRRGRLHQRMLAILGGNLAGGLTSALGGVFGGRDYSEVNCLVLGLVAKDGLVTTTALAMDSDRMVLLGRGRVDLRSEQLDVAFNPQPKGGLTSPAGMGLNLSELAKPFKLTGTLAQPRLSLDAGEALTTLGKSLGGMFLLGPAGLAVGLATPEGEPSGMCQEALAAARKGEPYQPKGGGGVTEPMKKAGEGLGGAINKLFGR